ncbi:hypothetical protein [Streptomyces sp. 2A115]|uniref:hypothetical protein n=1 Tax=Streptomyces sp. 2A115 TaxID=3457439 RepID=UPI003FD34754
MLLWMTPFPLSGIAMALVHVFRTADIYKASPPLLATAPFWELALSDLFTGACEAAPFGMRRTLLFGTPLSM